MFKIGDEVEVVGTNDYQDYNKLKQGDTFIIMEFDNTEDYLRDSVDGWGVHRNSCRLMPKGEYKVIKPFTLQDIMNAKPCNSNNEVWDLCEEFRDRDLSYSYKIESWTGFKSFKVMMKYKEWFVKEGFIEKVKVFEPFDLTFRIESLSDLETLWCHTGVSKNDADNCGKDYNVSSNSNTSLKYWRQVNRELLKYGKGQK